MARLMDSIGLIPTLLASVGLRAAMFGGAYLLYPDQERTIVLTGIGFHALVVLWNTAKLAD